MIFQESWTKNIGKSGQSFLGACESLSKCVVKCTLICITEYYVQCCYPSIGHQLKGNRGWKLIIGFSTDSSYIWQSFGNK